MKVFIIAENEKAARGLCAGARTQANDISLIALSPSQVYRGIADRIYSILLPQDVMLEDSFETLKALISEEGPDALYVEPTTRMRLLSARLAAHFRTSVISDVIDISDGVISVMYFGGLAHRFLQVNDPISILMLSHTIFGEVAASGSDEVVEKEFIAPKDPIKVKAVKALEKSDLDLNDAKRIIGVGRGFEKKEDLGTVALLAEKIGAAVGCTRPIVELEHWMPREAYMGVSGQILAPDIYLSIGISGQTQHTVGVDRAKTIIAINKDKAAPIFSITDYGIVADLYKVLPKLIERFS